MQAEAPAGADFVIPQDWGSYSAEEHGTWRTLYARQSAILPGRACDEYLAGLSRLPISVEGIPDFEQLSDTLELATGWRIVAVPGLVPEDVFFRHLAARRFPVTRWIRAPEQMDYLPEPDVFHDLFGHVPLLSDPVFADYIQAYGEAGLKAQQLGALAFLARLYWYTVEFGLIRTPKSLRIYGSGILSSRTESLYALDSAKPQRIRFDLMRVMATRYRIDDLQETYFVIDGFDQLFEATRRDFTPLYESLRRCREFAPGEPAAA